eukprot:408366-Heterocapsa_arctica.AAC.1
MGLLQALRQLIINIYQIIAALPAKMDSRPRPGPRNAARGCGTAAGPSSARHQNRESLATLPA